MSNLHSTPHGMRSGSGAPEPSGAPGRSGCGTSVLVAGSFTVEPCEEPLRWAASLLEAPIELRFLGFGQVMQSLLDPSSPFYANPGGANVLFVRPKDFPDAGELSDALHQCVPMASSAAAAASHPPSSHARARPRASRSPQVRPRPSRRGAAVRRGLPAARARARRLGPARVRVRQGALRRRRRLLVVRPDRFRREGGGDGLGAVL